MRTAPFVLAAVISCTLVTLAGSPLRPPGSDRAFAAASAGPLKVSPVKLSLKKQIFGTAGVTSPPKNVKLQNKGTDPIALLDVVVTGDFAVDPTASTCGASIAPAEKCLLAVTFTPTALGERLGQLTITHGALGSPQVVALKSTGVVGKLKFAPTSLKFPLETVGTTTGANSLTIHNPNAVPVPLTALGVSGDDFAIASRSCGTALAAGADCTIDVAFTPLAIGARKGILRIGALAKGSPKKIKLKGKGIETCAGVPADFLSDAANCGGCGNVCSSTCVQGQCQDATIACSLGTPDLCVCGSATACKDFSSDPSNCGGCGNVCFVGQTCEQGVCQGCSSVGAPDQCVTGCTSFQTDPSNCGGCGAACASGICVQGQCLACTPTAPNLCGGGCTSALTDAANCGGCGNTCPLGASCVEGECAGIACGGATPQQCGNRCVNLQTDRNHCGACGTVCAGGSCVGGQCVACAGDTPDQCGGACTDLTLDSANCGGCGNECPSGSTCSGGTCVALECSALSALQSTLSAVSQERAPAPRAGDKPDPCGNESVNLKTDPFNCGVCGKFCPSGACIDGKCLECTEDAPNACGKGCVNFFTDDKNCGGCGHDCKGDLCLRGVCQKGADCGGGVKTNTNIDKDNCGSCGTKCTEGPCVQGQCRVIKCDQDTQLNCNGKCEDATTERNCGACGKTCEEQRCVLTTLEGFKCSNCRNSLPDECSGKCTDLLADHENCGACGNNCGANGLCFEGECATCAELTLGASVDRCGDRCVNLNKDGTDCGACGKLCSEKSQCFAGKCTDCPASAPTRCEGFFGGCRDLLIDQRNCGACGHRCDDDNQRCVEGKCKGGATPCPAASPHPCGPGKCVDFTSDPLNCGGCGNVCPSGKCNPGLGSTGECDPGVCGAFRATAWNGTITESATESCGGPASLALAGTTSTFHLAPSSSVPGGCNVSGSVLLSQGGTAICGLWGGLWTCAGTVNAVGAMALTCNCLTDMPAGATFQANAYSGAWNFSASGPDPESGETVTDTASGSFVLNRQ